MIKVICIGHDYEYEVKELLKLFFNIKDVDITFLKYKDEKVMSSIVNICTEETLFLINTLQVQQDFIISTTELWKSGKKSIIEYKNKISDEQDIKKISKNITKKSIFKILKKISPIEAPWGILTGIRPTKIVHELLKKGIKKEEITNILIEDYCISEDKTKLLLEVAEAEYRFIYPINESVVSLYISIPFCPTRCVYCSFPSNSLQQAGHLIDKYVDCLCQEIKGTLQLLKKAKKTIQTIYIGGGTPTTLSLTQFSKIFSILDEMIDLKKIREFTVEAGRPDTIDYDKLSLLKARGVSRISINPQTMNDCTLQAIGRRHTVNELIEAYNLAQKAGFSNINMDIIIGLPGEDSRMVEHTMKELEKLSPSNLTVHTLAIKRASQLSEKKKGYDLSAQELIFKMLEITERSARNMGLKPYYMYRQKQILGNLENIGYAKPGFECIYNTQIMEEKQTIVGLGAGAVSKITFPTENRLERVPNVKNLEHYMNRVEEMVERKARFLVDNF